MNRKDGRGKAKMAPYMPKEESGSIFKYQLIFWFIKLEDQYGQCGLIKENPEKKNISHCFHKA